ncbi:hypothetical protein CISG_06605 [Coccidioides immitis RMSCC 3703]|uniref:Uncharacterized protein n=1 Tax=Coccidioides immitis RMSCC 3703 TaxID=454286 RepID=A0A0J8QZP4_COCIT|nr:hypothetical protein CISG_06605 [Coccidioides immitis RMSCC 3703]
MEDGGGGGGGGGDGGGGGGGGQDCGRRKGLWQVEAPYRCPPSHASRGRLVCPAPVTHRSRPSAAAGQPAAVILLSASPVPADQGLFAGSPFDPISPALPYCTHTR